jgi:hypothetical protein
MNYNSQLLITNPGKIKRQNFEIEQKTECTLLPSSPEISERKFLSLKFAFQPSPACPSDKIRIMNKMHWWNDTDRGTRSDRTKCTPNTIFSPQIPYGLLGFKPGPAPLKTTLVQGC